MPRQKKWWLNLNGTLDFIYEIKAIWETHAIWNAMPACRIPTMKVHTLIIIGLYEIIFRCVMWSKVKLESFFLSRVGWQFLKRPKIACIYYRFGLANYHKVTWIQPHKQTQFIWKWNVIHSVHFFFSSIWIISAKCYVICCSKNVRLRTHKPWEATPKFYL